MTNLLHPIIVCLETRQNLEIDFLSTAQQPLQNIEKIAVAYRRQGYLSISTDL